MLANVLSTQRHAILERFVGALRDTDLPPDELPKSVLLDGLPTFFDELVSALQTGARSSSSVANGASRGHGKQRFQFGFEIGAVIREYGVLRGVILDACEQAEVPVSIGEFRVLAERFNDAIAEAIEAFSHHKIAEIEREKHTAGSERSRVAEVLVLLDTLLDQTPLGIGFWDCDLRFVKLNRAFAAISGLPLSTHLGKSLVALSPLCPQSELFASMTEMLERVRKTGEAQHHEVSAESATQPGVTRWWSVTYYPVTLRDRAFGVGALCEEITKKRLADQDRARLLNREQRARLEAERASRLKDQFLATVSHELRTPLQSVMGWARALRGQTLGEDSLEKGLETIERNARLELELVEELLDTSGVLAQTVRLHPVPVRLGPSIAEVLARLAPAIDARQVSVTVDIAPSASHLVADEDRIQQIIYNLLSNSVKFSARGGNVHVRAVREHDTIKIAVEDDGRGIPAHFLPDVFEAFQQAEGSIVRAHGGLGLGLTIVKNLVELHGGTVVATSEGEGQGATFVVTLPIHAVSTDPASGEWARATVPPSSGPRLRGTRVLVVEDETDARELLAMVLEQQGAVVTAVGSAAEATAALGQFRPDVLVSDIAMPGEDGYSLIKRIRALEQTGAHIPAIALTAYARAEDRRRALDAGFSVHVAKPIDPADLISTVDRIRGKHS